ncbi:tRNA (guanine(26)-N(2))-dimethyltransferase-like [Patiria miniata]|uniref:tRNA (guanine(26)-N(2))-dimethyltransferase n=1 Tax=Patiria miniata TaxID=46514 RepID=A0A914AKV6_PATMI|nr:tRNA (guanine(26)-N(2))-dimethyltransferase-like [Patiria miniata]XP_038064199.1 tRNA (guanine(26)-N(2))-dimethyltransferase-like [Patiria miniata]XP_038064200.1 tRNA (guanine(26)-N(2))-dimethyltransferase-like [Patiria miniata]XP_038064201.1 tRNA (guanine(26)-N(2))-dimethyltransferase-like [Patiria miniata]
MEMDLHLEAQTTLQTTGSESVNTDSMDMEHGESPDKEATSKSATETRGATPETIREGQATIIFPSLNEVFYNPVQQFNRDLTIAVISVHAELQLAAKGLKVSYEPRNQEPDTADNGATSTEGSNDPSVATDTYRPGEYCQEGLCVLEGLSATGLRGVRYAKEIPGLKNIVANDWNVEAFKAIERNIQHNGVEHLVTASHADASLLMNQYRLSDRVDVVDLDPYGSPAKFLNGSMQAVKDGGILCVTCTDMAVLCGNRSEACYAKYGAMSLRTKYCQEMALRIVLHSIETHANLHHRYIEPLLSVSIDFYIRLFVRVHTSQSKVKHSAAKKALVYHCEGCDNFHLQRMGRVIPIGTDAKNFKYKNTYGPPVGTKCENCNSRFLLGGPLWVEPIHDPDFVKKLLSHVNAHSDRFHTSPRMKSILTLVSEELLDCPFYHKFSQLFHHVRSACPPMKKFRSALLNAGYQVSLSHITAEAVKTNAPHSVIWDIVKEWVKQNPTPRKRKLEEDCISNVILNKEARITVSFDVRQDAMPMSHKQGMTRFPANPAPNWGPKARAKPSSSSETLEEKRARLQDKRAKPKEPRTQTET